MRTAEQARDTAVEHLAKCEMKVLLIESKTEEFAAGWVFYYQSVRYLRTGEFGHFLVGNAPLFVPRNGAKPEHISYHRPTSESAEAFERCGNPNANPKAEVEIEGWNEGALKVSATQALREHSTLGLASAHAAVEQCLNGKPVRVSTTNVAAARELAAKLSSLQFIAKVTYGA